MTDKDQAKAALSHTSDVDEHSANLQGVSLQILVLPGPFLPPAALHHITLPPAWNC